MPICLLIWASFLIFKSPLRQPEEIPMNLMCPPIHPYLYTGLLFHLTDMKQYRHSHNVQGGPECAVCVCVKVSYHAAISARSSLPGLWFSFGSRSAALDQNSPPVFAISVSSPWGMADRMCHHTRCFFRPVWICILVLRSLGHGRPVCLRVHGEKWTRTTWVKLRDQQEETEREKP